MRALRLVRSTLTGEGTPRERRYQRAWNQVHEPSRILLIRLQAIGDAVAALPVAAGLRARYPRAHLALVIGSRAAAVGQTSRWFDEVFTLDLAGGWTSRMREAARLGRTQRGRWDIVLDLQRNDESRMVRRRIGAPAFGEMDRFSAHHGLERTLRAVTGAGLEVEPLLVPHLKTELIAAARARLEAAAPGSETFVLLNPAGCFATRRWPVERWVELASRFPLPATFVVSGLERVRDLAERLAAAKVPLVDLVGRSDLAQGLGAVAACDLVVSEDGAFLHAAWCGGVPTVALLGSTRSDWVRPLGPHARYRGSEDLSCGGCMAATCARGDLLCLERIGVDEVVGLALEVLRPCRSLGTDEWAPGESRP